MSFNCLSGIILRFGFCHHWALFVIEICFGEAITRRIFWKRRENFISNGLSLCRWFNSMCTQWRCFASPVLFWLFESKFYMYANMDDVLFYNHPCSAVSRILKTMNLLQILTKSSRLLWPPTSSQRQLGGQLLSSYKKIGSVLCELWWQWLFFVHVVTIVRNAQTTVASSFGLHFRCVWFIGPIATASQL